MNLGKARALIRLCVLFGTRAEGVGLDDIVAEFAVSRRTAARMRDAAREILDGLDLRVDLDGRRRWVAPSAQVGRSGPKPVSSAVPAALPGSIAALPLGATDFSALQAGATLLDQVGRSHAARRVENLTETLLAGLGRRRRMMLEPDIELLIEAEAVAPVTGWKRVSNPDLLARLQEAILASESVVIVAGASDAVPLHVEPHGILFGPVPWLVARPAGGEVLWHLRIDALREVRPGGRSFVRARDFDVESHARALYGAPCATHAAEGNAAASGLALQAALRRHRLALIGIGSGGDHSRE